MDAEAILAAIDEVINADDGSDDEGTVTLIAAFLGLRLPATH